MKDKTHDMNRGYSTSEAEAGCEILPNSDMATSHDRKMRAFKWANLAGNEAMMEYENFDAASDDLGAGFIPRNNYEDRF